jgi:hypothetical protein
MSSLSFCKWYVPTTKYSPVWKHGSLSLDRGTNSMQLGGRSNLVDNTCVTALLHLESDILMPRRGLDGCCDGCQGCCENEERRMAVKRIFRRTFSLEECSKEDNRKKDVMNDDP